jgi:hypothetical protein
MLRLAKKQELMQNARQFTEVEAHSRKQEVKKRHSIHSTVNAKPFDYAEKKQWLLNPVKS